MGTCIALTIARAGSLVFKAATAGFIQIQPSAESNQFAGCNGKTANSRAKRCSTGKRVERGKRNRPLRYGHSAPLARFQTKSGPYTHIITFRCLAPAQAELLFTGITMFLRAGAARQKQPVTVEPGIQSSVTHTNVGCRETESCSGSLLKHILA